MKPSADLCLLLVLSLWSGSDAASPFDLLRESAVSWAGALPCGEWDCECAFQASQSCCCVGNALSALEELTFIRMVGLWDGLSRLNAQIRDNTAGSIAFTAVLLPLSSCLGPFTSNISISYQSVSLNHGNGYNPALGTFTAPRSGLYSFSFTGYSKPGDSGERLYQKLQLMRDGQLVASSWEDNREDSEDSSSQTALLQLRRGAQVYVELLTGRQLCGDVRGLNSFSGYMIYANPED